MSRSGLRVADITSHAAVGSELHSHSIWQASKYKGSGLTSPSARLSACSGEADAWMLGSTEVQFSSGASVRPRQTSLNKIRLRFEEASVRSGSKRTKLFGG